MQETDRRVSTIVRTEPSLVTDSGFGRGTGERPWKAETSYLFEKLPLMLAYRLLLQEQTAAERKETAVDVVLLIGELGLAIERELDGRDQADVQSAPEVARELDHASEAQKARQADAHQSADPEGPNRPSPSSSSSSPRALGSSESDSFATGAGAGARRSPAGAAAPSGELRGGGADERGFERGLSPAASSGVELALRVVPGGCSSGVSSSVTAAGAGSFEGGAGGSGAGADTGGGGVGSGGGSGGGVGSGGAWAPAPRGAWAPAAGAWAPAPRGAGSGGGRAPAPRGAGSGAARLRWRLGRVEVRRSSRVSGGRGLASRAAALAATRTPRTDPATRTNARMDWMGRVSDNRATILPPSRAAECPDQRDCRRATWRAPAARAATSRFERRPLGARLRDGIRGILARSSSMCAIALTGEAASPVYSSTSLRRCSRQRRPRASRPSGTAPRARRQDQGASSSAMGVENVEQHRVCLRQRDDTPARLLRQGRRRR